MCAAPIAAEPTSANISVSLNGKPPSAAHVALFTWYDPDRPPSLSSISPRYVSQDNASARLVMRGENLWGGLEWLRAGPFGAAQMQVLSSTAAVGSSPNATRARAAAAVVEAALRLRASGDGNNNGGGRAVWRVDADAGLGGSRLELRSSGGGGQYHAMP